MQPQNIWRNEIMKVEETDKNNYKIPQKEELISLIVEGVPFIKIGRMYGVTDNSVRKWCKKYGLPFRRNDIKSLETSTCLT